VGGSFTVNPLATGGASGNAVTYSTLTSSVCTVSGTAVSIVAAGTCTIAANQTGNANYASATQTTQSVTITAVVPDAPSIGTASPGNAQATVSFSAPVSDGGSAITSYTVTCTPGGVTSSGAASPIVISGLTNNTLNSCSVAATNSAGTGSSSASVSVTPTSSSGPSNWANICTACHTTLPSGHQLNGAGTTGTVISQVRSLVPNMIATAAVQNLTATELADLAAYIALEVPVVAPLVAANTQVPIDLSSHITLNTFAFESVESVVQPTHGTLSAFSGTTVTYTPNPGYVGPDSFTYRGKNTTRGFVGDERTVAITVSSSGSLLTVNKTGNGGGAVTGTSINCGSSCATTFSTGTMVTLTATANAISSFSSWSGCDTVSGTQCTITVNAASTVTASFAALAFAPDEPVIGTATPGDAQMSITFTAPAFDGGSPVTSFKVTCQPGAISATGTTSPITVTGLTNGVSYACSATASNSIGEGLSSSSVSGTPQAAVQSILTLSGVVSRKTHGSTGDFDIAIDSTIAIGGAITTEPRSIGTGHRIVFQFNGPVTQAGTATTIDSSAAALGTASAAVNPLVNSEVVVTLTGVPDNQRVTVSLAGVNGSTNASASIGFLVGDTNNSRSVNASDISGVKARSGQTTDASNFKFDLNASGAINSADISAAKGRSGLVLSP
jgi:hypothetical protein